MSRPRFVTPRESERRDLDRVEQLLVAGPQLRLVGDDREPVTLPESVFTVLRDAVGRLSKGQPVALVPDDEDLSLAEAAALLGVSPASLRLMLDRDQILPYHRVGRQRRIRLSAITAYQQKQYEIRRDALRALTQQADALGAYDPPAAP